MNQSLSKRLEQYIVRTAGCWIWTGCKNAAGYGVLGITISKGVKRMIGAHRLMWQSVHGQISGGLVLDHICRNRGCVNPSHLEPVAQAENIRRSPIVGLERAEFHRAKTHCQSGHEYTKDNTRITKLGHRICRTCDKIRNMERYYADRAYREKNLERRRMAYRKQQLTVEGA